MTQPPHTRSTVSRRSLLAAAPATLIAASAGTARAATAVPTSASFIAAADVTPGAAADSIPDPLAITGSWMRTADGGQSATAGGRQAATALSEQQITANARLAATVTASSRSQHAAAALVLRANPDGTEGYSACLDLARNQVRLLDLATGSDLAAPVAYTANPGTSYQLEADLDGPDIKVLVNGTRVLHAVDHRYQSGQVGLQASNGTVTFGAPTLQAVNTNLVGWSTDGGTWTPTVLGWHATAPSNANIRAMSTTACYDLGFTAYVMLHDPYAVCALLCRADSAGQSGYAVQLDANQGRIRLYRIEDDYTLGTYATTLTTGAVYRLRIEAEGDELRVYLQTNFLSADGYEPKITAQDSTHASGRLGLQVYNGSASFDAITADDVTTDLQGWTDDSGTWTPDLLGVRARPADSAPALRTAPAPAADLAVSLDLTQQTGAAGIILRTDAHGSGGYEIRLDTAANLLTLRDRTRGTVLASAKPTIRALGAASAYRLEAHAEGRELTVLLDGVELLNTSIDAGSATGFVGLSVTGGTAYFQNVRARATTAWYTEQYRPGYHFSELAEYTSDPNGLVYYEGEYHLFHQDQGRWAHAVSTDLLQWHSLPIALPFSPLGNAWSGSAVVDEKDATGLFNGGSGLVAFYTSYNPDKSNGNQCVRVAYSADKGRSWHWYGTDPVVENPGGADGNWSFRDPKVLWDTQHNQWLMVVSGGDHIRFFSSQNLFDWTHISSFGYGSWVIGGVWECPDFFPLPVDGDTGNLRWVLTISRGANSATDGSSTEYWTGTWDGTNFSSDTPAGTVLRTEYGRDFYAAISYDAVPDGRRIWVGWMSNWDYPFAEPTGTWHGVHSVPRELSLTNISGTGYRLTQQPITELETLRGRAKSFGPLTLSPTTANPLARLSALSYEIEAEFALPASDAATEFGLRVRTGGSQTTLVGYDVTHGELFVDRTNSGASDFTTNFAGRTGAPLSPAVADGEKSVTLRLLVDASSVEAFSGDGLATITSTIFPDLDSQGMSCYAVGGKVVLRSLTFYPLADTTRAAAPVADPAPVSGGRFRSNYGSYTVPQGGEWSIGGQGLTGAIDAEDTLAMFATSHSDIEINASLRLGEWNGSAAAGALILRSSADGDSGYYVNFDPNLLESRLLLKVNGGFSDSGVLATAPLLLRVGATYPVRVLAQGSRIRVWLADGADPIIDVTDTTYTSGVLGFDVFGGLAAYQDAYGTQPSSTGT